MKKLIGGIICALAGVLLKTTGSTLFNIEVNGEKMAISGILDNVVMYGLVVIGVVLVAVQVFGKKK